MAPPRRGKPNLPAAVQEGGDGSGLLKKQNLVTSCISSSSVSDLLGSAGGGGRLRGERGAVIESCPDDG